MPQNMQKSEEKNIPNIIDCNLKHDYQISVIFGPNTFLQNWLLNYCLSFHLTQCLLLHYLGKSDQAKYALKW